MFLSSKSTFRMLLPMVGSMTGIVTILLVYILTRWRNHLPEGVVSPPISLLGCNPPEHGVYQLGFSVTGMMLLGAIEEWRHSFYITLQDFGQWTRFVMLVGGYLAVAGVVGQGVVTLEEDLLENFKAGKGMSMQSMLHQQLAAIFFLGASMHCYSTAYYILWTTWATNTRSRSSVNQKQKNDLTKTESSTINEYGSNTNSSSLSPSCCYGFWSVLLKLFCAVTSILSLPIAEMLHPARSTSVDVHSLNIGGLAQYIAVVSYIAFFGSYTLDFHKLQQSTLYEKETKQS